MERELSSLSDSLLPRRRTGIAANTPGSPTAVVAAVMIDTVKAVA